MYKQVFFIISLALLLSFAIYLAPPIKKVKCIQSVETDGYRYDFIFKRFVPHKYKKCKKWTEIKT